jgi:hypothetical protein
MPRGGFRRFIESLSSAFTKKPFEKWLGSAAKGSRSGTAAHRACKRTTQIGSCTERPIRKLAVIACIKNLQRLTPVNLLQVREPQNFR